MSKYTFSFTENDDFMCEECANNRKITYEADFDSAVIWEAPLKSFLDFLGSVYGYDISEHITVSTIIKSQLFNSVPRNGKDFVSFNEFDEEDDLK